MTSRKLHSLELLVVVSVCAFLFFYGLGNFGLVGADEPRYAQVAREMLERHDYITPTLLGEPWLEKPALFYWRAMFAFETFGVKDWAARMPSATFALGMIVVIFFHMRRFRPGAQLDAALITAACAGVIGFARGASTDMQLAAPFTVAMLGWYAWYETGKKLWLLDLYIFLAIATLAKGPVAPFLAGLIVFLFCGLRHDLKAALRTLWLPGVVAFFLIAMPWYVAVQLRNPKFLYVFVFEQNLARFGTEMFRHHQPWWYYLPVLMVALVPWTFFAIPALLDALNSCVRDWRIPRDSDRERRNIDSFPEFLVIWALIPIIFFSLSKSKLPGYILPSIAPCTILTADFLQRRRDQAGSVIVLLAHAALGGVIVALFLVFPFFFLQGHPVGRTLGLKLASVGGAVFVVLFVALRKGGLQYLRAVTLLPVILIIGFILRNAAPTIDSYYSARPVARELERMGMQRRAVAIYQVKRELRYGLEFYRNQKLAVYEEGTIPAGEHLVIARSTDHEKLQQLLGDRPILKVGEFLPQKIEYYWVSTAPGAHIPPLR